MENGNVSDCGVQKTPSKKVPMEGIVVEMQGTEPVRIYRRRQNPHVEIRGYSSGVQANGR